MARCTAISLAFLLLQGTAPARAEGVDYVLPSGDRVEGTRLSDMTAMAAQVARVRKAVRDRFAVEIGQIPVHVVSISDLKKLHDEVGGRLPSGWQLHGFAFEGHVFVRRGLGGVSDEVLIHECLHASSARFNGEAQSRGVGRLVEGVTQYLTLKALAARPPSPLLKAERNRTYVAATGLAETLATLVGEATLTNAYFRDGFLSLAGRVDKLTGGRHRLIEVARLLDAGDEQAASTRLVAGR